VVLERSRRLIEVWLGIEALQWFLGVRILGLPAVDCHLREQQVELMEDWRVH
jgi:hypothetical protein